ncbi:flagellar operon protein [Paenibacillus melissococcoides]|uniref:Flagellar operon protein n=1 Tax=Paenibacillus melissococcoides TaxID=2912268 RepID=A0ABM9FX81_9BACL|nr:MULTISPECIES: TIGR02530 family flagellar biosynthesis protein [Paenibacillus]MEB9896958.1 TIGR02530 family flagellar biosynthesis protein [Bacillus cereus]CAH8243778.1 flagellar operon protein [Paenibacillus melissococcoides]CAH8704623.1 flagellar operon protein [Paenibacillus melissococcoides]CAH8707395.1 flagellar operon protein [Paenibacillus melissococcoides]GIO80597.1 flagellar protein [Paenibacillus dendritiformis]
MNIGGPIGHLGPTAPIQAVQQPERLKPARQSESKASFQQLFQQELQRTNDVRFSHHARTRMTERGMNLTPELVAKMNQAMKQAEEKGARQSLVIMNNQAFIVNVPSRTVITALDEAARQNHVFTQIDSAILLND